MQNWRRIFYFLTAQCAGLSGDCLGGGDDHGSQPAGPDIAGGPDLISQPDGQPGELLVTQPASVPDQSDEIIEVTPELLEIRSILGPGDLETEQVLINHIGEKEVSLFGWQLQDQDGNAFTFPTLTMFQGGAVTIYTREGTSTVVELYWGLDEPIWDSGEQAFLLDPDGKIQATYTVP